MLKKIGFWVLVVAFITGAVYAYFYLLSAKKPKTPVASAIPNDCVFIIESSDFFSLWKKLNETNIIWQELQQVDFFKEVGESGKIIDSVLYNNSIAKEIFTDNPIYLCGIEQNNVFHYLYALNLDLNETDKLYACIEQLAVDIKKEKDESSGENIYEFKLKTGKGNLFLYLKDGLALLSKSKDVIKKSISCINKNCIDKDLDYKKIAEVAGTSVDFRFYLNNSWNYNLQKKNLTENAFLNSISNQNAGGWTGIDVDFKPNEMKLNGITIPDSNSFLNLFINQTPQEYNFVNNVPACTDNFMFIGFNNFEKLYKEAKTKNYSPSFTKDAKQLFGDLAKKLRNDIENDIIKEIDNEIALIHTKYNDGLGYNYCLIHLKDRTIEEKGFHLIADSVVHAKTKLNEEEHADSIYYFKNPHLIDVFSCGAINKQFNWCFFYNDYLIFCENPTAWANYLTEVSKGKVLSDNEEFIRFKKGNVADESNIFFYSLLSASKNEITDLVTGNLKLEFEKHAELFNKFHSFGFQLSSYKGYLLNQGYLLYSPIYNQHNNTVWEVKLDTTATMESKIVLNHKTGLEEIFTQDLNNTIYLISNTGKILWKKNIDGQVISDVYQIDYFQNNKLQYVFNTRQGIHLIDRNGNYVQDFPIKLNNPATNGLSVFDYEKTRDYRFVLACDDKKIHIFKGNAKEVDGFNFVGTQDSVALPIQWQRINFKDYLLAVDAAGNLYGLGRKGENRLAITTKIPFKNFDFKIEYGKDIDKTRLIYFAIEEKKIKKLYLNNKLSEFTINTNFEKPNSFFCRINDDDYYDLILIEGNEIEIYDDQGLLLQKVKTENELKPMFKQLRKNNEIFYSFIDVNNNLLIFSNNWKSPTKSGIKTSHLPNIEMLNDDGYYYMVGINDDLVSCYPF